ncbi:MAG TPA: GTPase HflX [Gemmatimonadota bacterium]|nr:GTPase HflX [Gemmatimonadota bacterium]
MTHAVVPLDHPEPAILVAVGGPVASTNGVAWTAEELLEELRALTISAGAEVVGEVVQSRDKVDASLYIGRGKADELKREVATRGAQLVVFDNDLSPAQGKNLEDLVGVRVVDRSELILDIFARRARTREAKLQVELAQLQYLLPRLRRMWTHLSRIRGGIGLRGPGETQLEVDRRVIRDRIRTLKEKLEGIETRRSLQRKGRGEVWNIALVGYTNVGKSTIMNRLTGERLRAVDSLFATLDATTRRMELQSGEAVVLTDTVGFIRDLPHDLVASFRATLEEVVHADLLLHVVDAADARRESRMAVVREVLGSLGAGDTPTLTVFNKFDRVPAAERAGVRARLLQEHEPAVVASAIEPRGLVALEEALARYVESHEVRVRAIVPSDDGRRQALIHRLAEVLERRYGNGQVEFDLRARPEALERLRREGIPVEPR